VKLGAIFCVAAFSLAACTDAETVGGGQGEGLGPSKVSGSPVAAPTPIGLENIGTILQQEAAEDVCESCVISYYPVRSHPIYDRIGVVSDGDQVLCTVFFRTDVVVADECGGISSL
jgi:hypothetical protein